MRFSSIDRKISLHLQPQPLCNVSFFLSSCISLVWILFSPILPCGSSTISTHLASTQFVTMRSSTEPLLWSLLDTDSVYVLLSLQLLQVHISHYEEDVRDCAVSYSFLFQACQWLWTRLFWSVVWSLWSSWWSLPQCAEGSGGGLYGWGHQWEVLVYQAQGSCYR